MRTLKKYFLVACLTPPHTPPRSPRVVILWFNHQTSQVGQDRQRQFRLHRPERDRPGGVRDLAQIPEVGFGRLHWFQRHVQIFRGYRNATS